MTDKKTEHTVTSSPSQPEKPAAAKKPLNGKRAPRMISDPNQIAQLVMMQLDAVNTKKDELTLSIKGLADITRQLARAYAQHTRTIQTLQQRVAKLEGKDSAK